MNNRRAVFLVQYALSPLLRQVRAAHPKENLRVLRGLRGEGFLPEMGNSRAALSASTAAMSDAKGLSSTAGCQDRQRDGFCFAKEFRLGVALF